MFAYAGINRHPPIFPPPCRRNKHTNRKLSPFPLVLLPLLPFSSQTVTPSRVPDISPGHLPEVPHLFGLWLTTQDRRVGRRGRLHKASKALVNYNTSLVERV